MPLPTGDWDIASFDASVESDLDHGIWTSILPDPIGTVVGGVLEITSDPVDASVAQSVSVVALNTAAMEVQVDGSGYTNSVSILGYLLLNSTSHIFYLIAGAGGIYSSSDGVTVELIYAVDLTADFHKIYLLIDPVLAECDFYLDGVQVASGYPLIDTGVDYGFETSILQISSATTCGIRWIGMSSGQVFPEGASVLANSVFSIGAPGIQITVDEYAHYNGQMSTADALEHYKIGRAIPV